MNNPYKRIRRLIPLLLAAVFIMTACQPAAVPQTGADARDLSIEITGDGVSIPEQATSGYVTVTTNNNSDAPQILVLGRLNTGVTPEQLSEAIEDPNAAIPLVTLVGGRDTAPGETQQFTANLQEGTYAAITLPESDDPPGLSFFEVTAGDEEGSPPEADRTVELVDFDFTMPENIPAGEQVWEVTNPGTQAHELYIVQPQPGFTEEQFLEMMQSEEEPEGPPPWEDVVYFGPISAGETGWITTEMEAGTYMAICFLPDTSGSGMPHVELGMIETFEVGGAGE